MKNMGYTLGNSTDADVMISLDYVFKMATTLDIKMTLPKTEQEKEVVQLRYGLTGKAPMRQREVAEATGISRSYISRIEKKALQKLRRELSGTMEP